MNKYIKTLESSLIMWSLIRSRVLARFLRFRGAKIGSKTRVGERLKLLKPFNLEVGKRVVFESDVYLKIEKETAELKIDDYTFLGRGVQIDVIQKVAIGKHTLLAPGVFITDHNHGMSNKVRFDQQDCIACPVRIGSDVWIGRNVTILPGVHIGDGSVVGANSVVNKNVEPYTVVGGNPAILIGKRD